MPLRVCTVWFKSPTCLTHGVDVEAETPCEAAGLGLARLKKDGWIEGLGPGTRLEIAVREPATRHSLTVQQLDRWLGGVTTSPAEVLRRARVKQLLGRVSTWTDLEPPLIGAVEELIDFVTAGEG